MTKKLLVILVFLLSPLFMMATDYYSVTADVLNVRNQPSKSGDVVGVVRRGDVETVKVMILGEFMKTILVGMRL